MPENNLSPRQGLKGAEEAYKAWLMERNAPLQQQGQTFHPIAQREEAAKENPVWGQGFLRRDPQYHERFSRDVLQGPTESLRKAQENFDRGNYGATALNVLLGAANTAMLPFAFLDKAVREIPGGAPVSDAAMYPFEKAGEAYKEAEGLAWTGLNEVLKLSPEDYKSFRQTVEKPSVKAFGEAASELGAFASQVAVGKGLHVGSKAAGEIGKGLIEKSVKPLPKKVAAPDLEVPDRPLLEMRPLDKRRQEASAVKPIEPSEGFIGDIYGQNKRVVPERHLETIQNLRVSRDNLEQKALELNQRLESVQSTLKAVRQDKTLARDKKVERVKALRTEALDITKTIEQNQTSLSAINDRLDYFGERVDKWRPEGRLLPEHAGIGEPTDMAGTNVPSNINFTKAKAKGKVISRMPEKMAPSMTGSPVDEMAGGRIEWTKDILKNNPRMKELLQKGIDEGREREIFTRLNRLAKKYGAESDLRQAVIELSDELRPRKDSPVEVKGIPEAATPEKANIVPTSYTENVRQYLKGQLRQASLLKRQEMINSLPEKPLAEKPLAEKPISETIPAKAPEAVKQKKTKTAIPAKDEMKASELKSAEDHIIEAPRSELPDNLNKKILEQAEQKLQEVTQARVEKKGARFRMENEGNGWEVTGATPSYTFNTFPQWFRELGEKKDRVVKALEKIIEDDGKDKGVLVERVKAVILDHLMRGEELSEVYGAGGSFDKLKKGTIDPDQEVTSFLEQFKGGRIRREDLKAAYEEYKKNNGITEQKLTPEVETLAREAKRLEVQISALDGDPFTDQSTIQKLEAKLKQVNDEIKKTAPGFSAKDYKLSSREREEAKSEAFKVKESTPKVVPDPFKKGRITREEYLAAKKDAAHRVAKGMNTPSLLGQLETLIDKALLKDYLTEGRYLIEQGIDRFPDWSRKMVNKYKETIRPHLRDLFKVIVDQREKDRLQAGEKKEAPKNLQDLRQDIKSAITVDNVPLEVQGRIRDFAEDYLKSHQMLTWNRHKNATKFGEKLNILTLRYGQAGGELGMRLAKGDGVSEHLVRTSYERWLNPLRDLQREYKGHDLFFRRSGERVIKALEDRKNKDKYLTDELDNKLYSLASGLFDFYKGKLSEAGYKVLDNYFTHMLDVNKFEEVMRDIKTPDEMAGRGLTEFLSADSPFLKHRRPEGEVPYSKDLMGVLEKYVHNVSRAVAYKDALDYYYTQFKNDIPLYSSRDVPAMDLARQFIKASTDPEINTSPFFKAANFARNQMYRAFLWNNLKSTVQNGFQKELAKMFMADEAKHLTREFFMGKKPTGRLSDALSEIKNETSLYMEAEKNYSGGIINKANEAMQKFDSFQWAERRNWKYAELGGIINSAVKNPLYRQLTASGKKPFEAIEEILSDQTAFEKAVREGIDLSSRTQISPSRAYRPTFYDSPTNRIWMMLTRYKIATTGLAYRTLLKPLDGAEGLRSLTILRRGVFDDARPVNQLRAVEYWRHGIEKAIKMAEAEPMEVKAGDFDVRLAKEYVKALKNREKGLRQAIKNIEPLSGDKGKMAYHWGRYLSETASVSLLYMIAQNYVYNSGADFFGYEKREKPSKGTYGYQLLRDAVPLPVQNLNPKTFGQPSLLPEVALMYHDNFNARGVTRELVNWSANLYGPSGAASRLAKQTTGFDLGRTVSNEVVPQKKKKYARPEGRRRPSRPRP